MSSPWDYFELIESLLQAPAYHLIFEVLLILWIFKLLFFAKSYTADKKLSEKEKDELVAEWQPEPLVPDVPDDHPLLKQIEKNIVSGRLGKYIEINSRKCLNMATLNFLSMVGDPSIEEEALKTLRIYGVGSCGPRGFYGTMDVHLQLEERLAKFMNVEEAILYSYGFATIASAIPAYSKRGDVIFCDEGVCFSIQKGLQASRSIIRYFKHNDMEDLERLLQEQAEVDRKNPKKAKVTRKFMVVEGLYVNYGDICPLPKLVELKWKYKVRIFLEESCSFGVLGATGKGVTEHFNISTDEITLMAASLENSIGSCGGFCCGKSYVVDHQRLSGLGYCFSASLPPMLATAATEALNIIERKPEILQDLRNNCQRVHEGLLKIQGLSISGSPIAAIKHIRLEEPTDDRDIDCRTLQTIIQKAQEKNVALTQARYLDKEEHLLPPPSIRLSMNNSLCNEEVDNVIKVLTDVCNEVLTQSS